MNTPQEGCSLDVQLWRRPKKPARVATAMHTRRLGSIADDPAWLGCSYLFFKPPFHDQQGHAHIRPVEPHEQQIVCEALRFLV